jgi:iron-sulfur cluster assembly protein CyaY
MLGFSDTMIGASRIPPCYTGIMMDEGEFRRRAEAALEELKRSLFAAEEDGDFEVEEQGGVLNILFEEPAGKFVVTPNAPVRQIWISALATSFKLDWDETQKSFVLAKSGEALKPLIGRLINEHLGSGTVRLN